MSPDDIEKLGEAIARHLAPLIRNDLFDERIRLLKLLSTDMHLLAELLEDDEQVLAKLRKHLVQS